MSGKALQRTLIASGVVSLALWATPGLGLLTLPLVYLNTHLHELSHAFAGLLSGGDVRTIRVFASGSGVTEVAGGFPIALASAGYLGASLFGAAIIACSSNAKAARGALWAVAALVAVGMVLWVRGDAIGVLSGLGWIALLVVLARRLSGPSVVFAAQFVGMQQCLASVQSLWVLLQINAISGIENDAKLAERSSGIPGLLWAVFWCAVSGLAMVVALRLAWRGGPNRRAE